MFYFGDINFKESILSKKLVFTSKKYKYNKLIVHITLWLPFFILAGTIYFNEGYFPLSSLLFALWACWASYLKEVETNFVKVKSNLKKDENQYILRNYIKDDPLWEFKRNIDHNFISITNHGLGIWDKIAIIIFDQDDIYIVVIGNNPRLKQGTYYSKNLIKTYLEEELNKKLPTTPK